MSVFNVKSDSRAALWPSHLWRHDCHPTLINSTSLFGKSGTDSDSDLRSLCWFQERKYFSQYDFKVDFFLPITPHVGSKLALREYFADHHSLMYWGVILDLLAQSDQWLTLFTSSVSEDLKDFLLTRKVIWRKKNRAKVQEYKEWLAKWWYHQVFKAFANWSLLHWHFVFYSALIGISLGAWCGRYLIPWCLSWQNDRNRCQGCRRFLFNGENNIFQIEITCLVFTCMKVILKYCKLGPWNIGLVANIPF